MKRIEDDWRLTASLVKGHVNAMKDMIEGARKKELEEEVNAHTQKDVLKTIKMFIIIIIVIIKKRKFYVAVWDACYI